MTWYDRICILPYAFTMSVVLPQLSQHERLTRCKAKGFVFFRMTLIFAGLKSSLKDLDHVDSQVTRSLLSVWAVEISLARLNELRVEPKS